MIQSITDLSADSLSGFDLIIDVRSPGEFAEDHLPGAVNLPVLDNAERARIGTIYKQYSPYEARRQGAALVARNIARHIETALKDRPATFHPLIYCWRGGMRSNAMATVFKSIGWRSGVVQGGYKAWRRQVTGGLRGDAALCPVILIDGPTGTAKTDIVRALIRRGAQAVDLEGLAGHKGSVFGGREADQPAQKLFESRLWSALRGMDLTQPVLLEAESSLIGRIHVPRALWSAMQGAPRIEVSAPQAARLDFLLSAYSDLLEDPAAVSGALDRIADFQPKARMTDWRGFVAARDWRALAAGLMAHHYDPLYARARKKRGGEALATIALSSLSPDAIEDAAAVLARL